VNTRGCQKAFRPKTWSSTWMALSLGSGPGVPSARMIWRITSSWPVGKTVEINLVGNARKGARTEG
jgi:hypothetical protein